MRRKSDESVRGLNQKKVHSITKAIPHKYACFFTLFISVILAEDGIHRWSFVFDRRVLNELDAGLSITRPAPSSPESMIPKSAFVVCSCTTFIVLEETVFLYLVLLSSIGSFRVRGWGVVGEVGLFSITLMR